MKNIEVHIVSAFEHQNNGGNPAGIVFDADSLTPKQRLEIASQVGLSETAFVSRSVEADYKLDFFTPTRQIAHCGHATIATFTYLKQQGKIAGDRSSKETVDGVRQIYFEGTSAFMEQTAPKFISISKEDRESVLSALGIIEQDLLSDFEIEVVNTGNSFLIVPVKNERVLEVIVPQHELIERLSERYGLIGFYVYSPSGDVQTHATSRMFAPFYGIKEEAATGMAAGPLVAYLYHYGAVTSEEIVISQGKYMNPPSPSLIKVRLKTNKRGIEKLYAGGGGYLSGVKSITVGQS
ncbi:PhzF family phenazine biosynthesis protein [Fulvivirga sp. 29W222]|uniref:PhzF family phenazine biosynthesis protein n=1 Tax=Fulvivirga marina TaxID=2494733 RepID=A0A937FYQ8_9BACT|nr:PhzF family phenazine biosynthesis protein [Fulvivirga marina]MBL6446963.1 PhzF family phenazine biosynthesis protein [Fulvivirga marina]